MVFCLMLGILSLAMAHAVNIIERRDWGARQPRLVEPIVDVPVPFVIIHHSYQPAACFTPETCSTAMRSMQRYHQDDRGWNDIGYTFGIGGDGQIYNGRGFDVVGAHAPRFNDKSIGICMIGDWTIELPPAIMIEAAHKLIAFAVASGHLQRNYTLLGHRQVRQTECPGERLFEEITTWPRFSPTVPQT